MMRAAGFAVLTTFVLAGCGIFDRSEPPPCPRASILADAAQVVRYREGPGRDLTDVEFQGEVTRLSSACEYQDRGAMVEMTVTVTIDVERGPALAQGQQRRIAYFVSVVDRFNQEILNKAEFEIPFGFPAGRSRLTTGEAEQITQRIPIRPGRAGTDYEVLVGFRLTQEELDINRRRRGS